MTEKNSSHDHHSNRSSIHSFIHPWGVPSIAYVMEDEQHQQVCMSSWAEMKKEEAVENTEEVKFTEPVQVSRQVRTEGEIHSASNRSLTGLFVWRESKLDFSCSAEGVGTVITCHYSHTVLHLFLLSECTQNGFSHSHSLVHLNVILSACRICLSCLQHRTCRATSSIQRGLKTWCVCLHMFRITSINTQEFFSWSVLICFRGSSNNNMFQMLLNSSFVHSEHGSWFLWLTTSSCTLENKHIFFTHSTTQGRPRCTLEPSSEVCGSGRVPVLLHPSLESVCCLYRLYISSVSAFVVFSVLLLQVYFHSFWWHPYQISTTSNLFYLFLWWCWPFIVLVHMFNLLFFFFFFNISALHFAGDI